MNIDTERPYPEVLGKTRGTKIAFTGVEQWLFYMMALDNYQQNTFDPSATARCRIYTSSKTHFSGGKTHALVALYHQLRGGQQDGRRLVHEGSSEVFLKKKLIGGIEKCTGHVLPGKETLPSLLQENRGALRITAAFTKRKFDPNDQLSNLYLVSYPLHPYTRHVGAPMRSRPSEERLPNREAGTLI